jgi:hypothetical protein
VSWYGLDPSRRRRRSDPVPLFPSRVEAIMVAFAEYAGLQESLVGDFVIALGGMSGNL